MDLITDFDKNEGDLIEIQADGFNGITDTTNFKFDPTDSILWFAHNPIATLESVVDFDVAKDIVLI